MKPYYYNTKYYVIENTLYPNYYGLKSLHVISKCQKTLLNKRKYYRIYNIHGCGTRYNVIEGDIKNNENSFHIDKNEFNEIFFTIYELRKIKLKKLNEI